MVLIQFATLLEPVCTAGRYSGYQTPVRKSLIGWISLLAVLSWQRRDFKCLILLCLWPMNSLGGAVHALLAGEVVWGTQYACHCKGPGPVYLHKGAGLTDINEAISDNDTARLEQLLSQVGTICCKNQTINLGFILYMQPTNCPHNCTFIQ